MNLKKTVLKMSLIEILFLFQFVSLLIIGIWLFIHSVNLIKNRKNIIIDPKLKTFLIIFSMIIIILVIFGLLLQSKKK